MNAATVREHKTTGVPIVLGDATRNSVLRAAGISRARVLVLAINDAEAARRAVALARSLAPNLHVIARVTYLAEAPLFRSAGAQEIVPAELETSVEIMVRVLRRFLVPDDAVLQLVRTARAAVDAPKVAAIDRPDAGRIAEYVPGIGVAIHRVEAGSVAAARSLAEVGVRRNTGCSVVAVRRGGENLPIVTPETVLAAGDVVVVIGPESRLADVAAMFAAAVSETGETKIVDQHR
jgi:CPA2 family monovalent cation:H+ antiporter-2